ncbi:MAG: outer membrane beta-barrel family protein, partial [Bacteroidota bacterium]
FLGYEKTVVGNIRLSKVDKEIILENIALSQAVNTLKDVEVSADRNYVDYKIDKKVVNVSQHINAEGGSAADVLDNVPSVNVDIDGNVTLRGSASYTVLIDGKPTPLQGSEVLKQIPASIIETIEIITNPSAKYDPDGTTGIINIILKKEKTEGFNGMASVTAATWDKFGGNLNLNVRKTRVNYFLDASYSRDPMKQTSFEDRTNFMSDTTLLLDENSERINTFRPWRINSGADFYLDDHNTVTVSGTIGSYAYYRDFSTKYYSRTQPISTELFLLSNNTYTVDGIYYSGNVNYTHDFSKNGHKIQASVTAWQWNGDQGENSDQTIANSNWEPAGAVIRSRTIHTSMRDNLRIQADYTLPVGKGQFESGILAHLNPGSSDFRFEDYDPDSREWINNPAFTNFMSFQRDIYSAYSTFSGEMKGIGFQFGLRGEYTDRMVHQETTGEKYPVELFNYYPSVHFSKQLPKNQQVQLSYSRRINRPQPYELNPFPNYSDSYNFSKGNPYLKPEDIDAFEFNYFNRIKKGFLSAGLYYRITHDTKVMDITIDSDNRLYLQNSNLDNTYAYGSEAMLNLDPLKWLNLNISGDAYQYELLGSLEGKSVNKSSFNWDIQSAVTFKFNATTRLQLTGYYSSPTAEAVGTREAMYGAGIAARKDVLKKQATISLNVQDVLMTQAYNINTLTDSYESHIGFKGESPVVRLTFSYRINNYQRQQSQENQIDLGVGGNMM